MGIYIVPLQLKSWAMEGRGGSNKLLNAFDNIYSDTVHYLILLLLFIICFLRHFHSIVAVGDVLLPQIGLLQAFPMRREKPPGRWAKKMAKIG
jgi:hypothetical protein